MGNMGYATSHVCGICEKKYVVASLAMDCVARHEEADAEYRRSHG